MKRSHSMNVVAAGATPKARTETMRTLARLAHERQDVEFLKATWIMFEQLARDLLAAPVAPADLAPWQKLALDFEVAFQEVDPEVGGEARRLASEIRTATAMIERNPADQIARRPTAMRVLNALVALGGSDCSLAEVRSRASMGATHMSNILKVLAAHGMVSVEAARADGRERRLSITAKGAVLVEASGRSATTADYHEHLQADTSHEQPFRKAVTHRSSRTGASQHRQAPSFRSSLESA
jgi:DNA-binding MarR family transcriptional regulator